MQLIEQKFTIHPVGQGLFYSGCIKTDQQQASFSMVMDCGSLSGAIDIRKEIDRFKAELMPYPKVLDLLVISHFDADHVNQIKYLLGDSIKVKRIVMPFLGFAERLFLVLKEVDNSNGYNPLNEEALQFTLDPLGSIKDNLDGDTEIYLVENDDDPIDDSDNNDDNPESTDSNDETFIFDYVGKQFIPQPDLINMGLGNSPATIYKVYDSKKGNIKGTKSFIKLMDFLFYKRPLKDIEKEQEFYGAIFEMFCIKSNLAPQNIDPLKLIEGIKALNNASCVKEWFKNAAEDLRLPVSTLTNLNTTALCLLHRNLKGIVNLVYGKNWNTKTINRQLNIKHTLHHLHVFKHHTKILPTSFFGYYIYLNWYYNLNNENFFIYPNTLLTSDGFIRSESQLQSFTNKFNTYLRDIWLMQIPHHGSKNNLKSLDFKYWYPRYTDVAYFINYGLSNRDDHPDNEIIDLLENEDFYTVHERQGLEYGVTFRYNK